MSRDETLETLENLQGMRRILTHGIETRDNNKNREILITNDRETKTNLKSSTDVTCCENNRTRRLIIDICKDSIFV